MAESDYPTELRDELFQLFLDCLGAQRAEDRWRAGVQKVSARTRGSWVKGAFLDDRSPRYEAALRQAAELRKPLPAPPGAGPAEGTEAGRYDGQVQLARILFNQGLFFDCGELLEPAWDDATGRERRSLQGLIQAGAGFHHLERGSPAGCAKLLKEAADKLAGAAGPGLQAFGLALLEAADRAASDDLTPEQAPQLGADGLEL